jgi:outer membrane protein assembly factor BamB
MSVKRIVMWGFVGLAVFGAILVKFFGFGLTLSRSGKPSIVKFKDDRETHYRKLEESRASQQAAPEETAAVAVAAPAAAPGASEARSSYWSDFRGPNRLGIYAETPILTQWPSSGLQRLWKQPVGAGWASFVVAHGLIYTIEQRRNDEVVAAYDAATGKEKWLDKWATRFDESMGGEGPRATPVVDETRLYALGAEGELRCLDARTGKVIWNKNILREYGAMNIPWAVSHSPLVVEDKLIVLPGGGDGKSVVALDKMTGKLLWGSQDDEQSYTSPMVAEIAGKRQLIVVSAKRAMGLTIEDGKLLWEYPWVTEYNVNAAQPIVTHANRFFISAGYGHGAALVELTPGGEKFSAKTVWQNTKMKSKFNSPVLYQGHVYGLDEGILACVSADTGEQKWKGGRYGYGQILLASGHLVVISESGELALVKATPDGHAEVAKFEAISGKTWAYPAISQGVVYVRNTREMAAFRIGM